MSIVPPHLFPPHLNDALGNAEAELHRAALRFAAAGPVAADDRPRRRELFDLVRNLLRLASIHKTFQGLDAAIPAVRGNRRPLFLPPALLETLPLLESALAGLLPRSPDQPWDTPEFRAPWALTCRLVALRRELAAGAPPSGLPTLAAPPAPPSSPDAPDPSAVPPARLESPEELDALESAPGSAAPSSPEIGPSSIGPIRPISPMHQEPGAPSGSAHLLSPSTGSRIQAGEFELDAAPSSPRSLRAGTPASSPRVHLPRTGAVGAALSAALHFLHLFIALLSLTSIRFRNWMRTVSASLVPDPLAAAFLLHSKLALAIAGPAFPSRTAFVALLLPRRLSAFAMLYFFSGLAPPPHPP